VKPAKSNDVAKARKKVEQDLRRIKRERASFKEEATRQLRSA
jgi:hypothetical protein